VKIPDRSFYSFPYSFKPAKAARTHVKNENFNPDFVIRLRGTKDILVVEIKGEEDRDKNRSAAKFRDGKRQFATLNQKLASANKSWTYCFLFLSPDDFTKSFKAVEEGKIKKWTSSLMHELEKAT
jgi:type III restriction enzyme